MNSISLITNSFLGLKKLVPRIDEQIQPANKYSQQIQPDHFYSQDTKQVLGTKLKQVSNKQVSGK